MFDIKFILLLILLGIVAYMIYNLYSFVSNKINKIKEDFNEKIDIDIDDVMDKLDVIEARMENIDKKFVDCNEKVHELHMIQQTAVQVNEMNAQSVLNRMNQYDEENEDTCGGQDQIFNSVENSCGNGNGNGNGKRLDDLFVKSALKENFYMSPADGDESESGAGSGSDSESVSGSGSVSETKSRSEIESRTRTSPNVRENTHTYNDDNRDQEQSHDANSVVLEISDEHIKSYIQSSADNSNTPKITIAVNSLTDIPSIIKNNSMDDLQVQKPPSENDSVSSTQSQNILDIEKIFGIGKGSTGTTTFELLDGTFKVNPNKISIIS